jgi:hypothetical protein
MSEGPELPAWAKPRRPPETTARPIWLVVLGLAMLVFGGVMLNLGVRQLREPGWQRGIDPGVSAQVTEDVQAVNESLARAYREHPTAVRINGASKLVMALLLLFAVAAVFASDPRARQATMVAAWAGIAHQIGDVIFMFRVFRRGVIEGAQALVNLAARNSGGGKVPTASAVISAFDVFIVGVGVLGILFSVVLLTFFGGRRGRTFFGVGADIVRRQPHHGG